MNDAIDAVKDALLAGGLHAENVGFLPDDVLAETLASVALDALLSPQSTECDAPGCDHGTIYEQQNDVHGACPSCNGSGRIEKGPIAYLSAELEPANFVRVERIVLDGSAQFPHDPLMTRRAGEPLYRLPSESTNGVKDEN